MSSDLAISLPANDGDTVQLADTVTIVFPSDWPVLSVYLFGSRNMMVMTPMPMDSIAYNPVDSGIAKLRFMADHILNYGTNRIFPRVVFTDGITFRSGQVRTVYYAQPTPAPDETLSGHVFVRTDVK